MENMKNHAAQQTRCSFTRKINFSFKHFEWFHGIKPISDLSSILVDSILRLLQTSLHENRFSAFLRRGQKSQFQLKQNQVCHRRRHAFLSVLGLSLFADLYSGNVFRKIERCWRKKNNTNTNCLTSLIKKLCVSFFKNGKMGQIICVFDRLSKWPRNVIAEYSYLSMNLQHFRAWFIYFILDTL